MKNVVLSALAVAALAGTAVAQPVRLEFQIVRVSPTVPGTTAATRLTLQGLPNDSVTTTSGTTMRFQLQYRILNLVPDVYVPPVLDDNGDVITPGYFSAGDGAPDSMGHFPNAIVPDGLSSASINITSGLGRLQRALLSNNQNIAAGTPPLYPDASGNQGTRRGLVNPYRGGMSDSNINDLPSNGITNDDSNADPALYGTGPANTLLSITPVAINSNAHQGNELFYGNPNSAWYDLYCFTYTAGASNDVINVGAIPDPQTGNTFGYFSDSNAVPLTSTNSGTASYRIIVPAPGAAALVGLGGLLVARRRRA